jgi:hypothetical protein
MPRRTALITAMVCQTLLLYLTTSRVAGSGALYGCTIFCGGGGANVVIPTIAALFGVAMFVLPALIGALCNGWQGSLALAAAPWWLAVIAHAGTLLRPYIGLGGTGGRFDAPFWLDANRLIPLLGSLALFAFLGWLGWLARRAVRTELSRLA